MELALDVLPPEFEELVQLGKIGREVEFLPDEALQQGGVVGQPVDDLRGGEPVPFALQLEEGHVRASRSLYFPVAQPCRFGGSGAIEKHERKQRVSSQRWVVLLVE